jgi:hypothetical protein
MERLGALLDGMPARRFGTRCRTVRGVKARARDMVVGAQPHLPGAHAPVYAASEWPLSPTFRSYCLPHSPAGSLRNGSVSR